MYRGGLSAAIGVLLALPTTALADIASLNPADRDQLAIYARDTWRSLAALSDSGALPADSLTRTDRGWTPSAYTSPTNVAAYLWSTLAAEDLKLIGRDESTRRLGLTLNALARVERSHGFFYNWYDPRSGDRLAIWPGGGRIRPFLSTVDNGWIAAALMMVSNARPEFRPIIDPILGPMNFGFFYDAFDPENPVEHPGLLRGGFFPEENAFAPFHYGMLNTEPRIASYIGIARGDIPAEHYFRMTRSIGDVSTPTTNYLGVAVCDSVRAYRGMKFVPTWDGTMFEALMVPLFVPEDDWAGESWGRNHSIYTKAQIEYGMRDAKIGYWGISASCNPDGGYAAYGVNALGVSGRRGNVPAIVTPHASFLALRFAPRESMDNLKALATAFPTVYGANGFLDAVDVATGRVSDNVLSLDQGMILASIANALVDNTLQKKFTAGIVEATVRPMLLMERFASGLDEPIPSAPALPELAQASPAPAVMPDREVVRASEVLPARTNAAAPRRRRKVVA